ncbi:sigma 54-interacting transcriptional regulator [Aeromonas diversa]|uniref:Two-component system response regulator n=1 Tax=Aeromonas diversa CDC 2478-85 TaxID=1268237 RepID=N9V6C0_9GAMM|nr:sigma 54-interacting transcriptional regulator [Aeromonas diversa]ENY70832.1 two-component system response regulator [Aeromonas diversa CDC 2478-85]
MAKGRILLVDDDQSLLKLLTLRLRGEGYEVIAAESGEQAIMALRQQRPDLVLTDLRMEGMDGLSLFERIQGEWLGMPVIIMTAHGTIPDAITATRSGVFSFLTKPIDKQMLLQTLEQALSITAPVVVDELESQFPTRSSRMQQSLQQARSVAAMEVNVLITGPSGCGKSRLAEALHRGSPRRAHPFLAINCAATPFAELEEALFGHPGAPGLFEQAQGGTLCLDEIGDLSASLQAKLLRVMGEPGAADRVRVIGTTHRDLVKGMEEGTFREDLYYRLNVANVTLPPLEERSEDIPLLARLALDRVRLRQEGVAVGFAPEALALLAKASWPGNVRQLCNLVERLAALCPSPVIGAAMVESALSGAEVAVPSFNDARAEFEKEYLIRLLRITEGNVTLAASMAERNRTDFYKLLSRHNIEAAHFKPKG